MAPPQGRPAGAQQAQQRAGQYPTAMSADDMKQRLQQALRSVEENAFLMNRAIDSGNLDETLKFAVKMLRELRVGALSPKSYYELWMAIFDRLRQLHSHFLDLNARGLEMAELYKKVQSTNHIIPRLYLMITVGSAFIIKQEAATKDILQDLIEMSKGVQHPMRGLFLRNFLLKMTQDKLTKEYDTTTEFCVSYLLQNFSEMNRLWVRMQHQGNPKNRAKREKERRDLKVLISFNLVRLSELEAMSLEKYRTLVLDRILDIVANCKDTIAQQYLLDVMVQVFPSGYHLETLTKLFDCFEHLEDKVNLKTILVSLMERIKFDEPEEDDEDDEDDDGHGKPVQAAEEPPVAAKVESVASEGDKDDEAATSAVAVADADADADAEEGEGEQEGEKTAASPDDGERAEAASPSDAPTNVGDKEASPRVSAEAFETISACISKIIAERTAMSAEDTLDLQVALLDFAVTCYPGQLHYIDTVLGYCASFLMGAEAKIEAEGSANVVDILVMQLLKVPLRQKELGSIELLNLTHFPSLMGRLTWASKKKVAHGFLQHCLSDDGLLLDDPDKLTKLLAFVAPLIQDEEGAEEPEADAESPAFVEQQQSVAKLVHRFRHEDPAVLFQILNVARKHFSKGGVKRIRYTLVPLCFRYIVLADALQEAKPAGEEAGGADAPNDGEDEDPMQKMLREQAAGSVSTRKVFQFVHEIASALSGVVELQEMALRMFLQAAQAADRAAEQEVAYEFMAQAFTLYEEIADSKEQLRTLPVLVGTLQRLTVFDKESFETLATKVTQYAARLLKKGDQCKMVILCAHLFWSVEPERALREGEKEPAPGKDGARALECLQRSLKIADNCVPSSLHASLFVEILNRYLYFYVAGMDSITAKNVSDLVALTKGNMDEQADDAARESFFANTLQHIRNLQEKHKEDDKYASLAI